MTSIIVVAAVILVCLLILSRVRRTLQLHRSVLLHVSVRTAWATLVDVPRLLTTHGRGNYLGGLEEHSFVRGDEVRAGTIWRTWDPRAPSRHWAEMKIVRYDPEREIGIRLMRDSLRTHRGLLDHLGSLSLEPIRPDACKLVWELRAHFSAFGLLADRLFAPGRLKARLLDLRLRSIKVAIDESPAAAAPLNSETPGTAGLIISRIPNQYRDSPEPPG